MNKYNTDCFSQNVLLDLLHLQRQLCISQPFGICFLYSKKISPFYFFYGAFWSKIGDLNSHPQFGKLMCWPLTLILHIKVGSQALPVPYLTWFFWRDGFTTNSPLVFTAAFTQVTREREGLLDFHIYNMTKKTSDLPLNAKNTPTFVLKAGAFLRLYQFLVWLFPHYFIVKQRYLLE